ncbi:MAG: MarR family transcriptional regulator [Planctomycetota bacterium]|nr:MarR family transcriptional regulator [Planctomycetota bacterium]
MSPKPKSSDPAEAAFRAFVRASGLFRNRMDPYFARYGISASQWGVLRALQRAENEGLDGLQLSVLGQRLLVRPPSVTTLIDRLERIGLVSRRPDREDQRAKQVALTPAGRELVARVLVKHPAEIRGIMGCLSEPEQREFQRLMERVAAHLETSIDSISPDPRNLRDPRDPRERRSAAAGDRRP